jgi:hypothetical protein
MNPFAFNFISRLICIFTFGIIRVNGTLRNPETGEIVNVGVARYSKEKEND